MKKRELEARVDGLIDALAGCPYAAVKGPAEGDYMIGHQDGQAIRESILAAAREQQTREQEPRNLPSKLGSTSGRGVAPRDSDTLKEKLAPAQEPVERVQVGETVSVFSNSAERILEYQSLKWVPMSRVRQAEKARNEAIERAEGLKRSADELGARLQRATENAEAAEERAERAERVAEKLHACIDAEQDALAAVERERDELLGAIKATLNLSPPAAVSERTWQESAERILQALLEKWEKEEK